MILDWSISLGSLITGVLIVFSGAGFYWRQIYDSRHFKEEITEIKTYLRTLNDVVVKLALQTERLDTMGIRLNKFEDRLDELRHGKGFVVNHDQ